MYNNRILHYAKEIYAEWMRRKKLIESGIEVSKDFGKISNNMRKICQLNDELDKLKDMAKKENKPLKVDDIKLDLELLGGLMKKAKEKVSKKEDYLKAISDGEKVFRKQIRDNYGVEAEQEVFDSLTELDLEPKCTEMVDLKLHTIKKPEKVKPKSNVPNAIMERLPLAVREKINSIGE